MEAQYRSGTIVDVTRPMFRLALHFGSYVCNIFLGKQVGAATVCHFHHVTAIATNSNSQTPRSWDLSDDDTRHVICSHIRDMKHSSCPVLIERTSLFNNMENKKSSRPSPGLDQFTKTKQGRRERARGVMESEYGDQVRKKEKHERSVNACSGTKKYTNPPVRLGLSPRQGRTVKIIMSRRRFYQNVV